MNPCQLNRSLMKIIFIGFRFGQGHKYMNFGDFGWLVAKGTARPKLFLHKSLTMERSSWPAASCEYT